MNWKTWISPGTIALTIPAKQGPCTSTAYTNMNTGP